MTSIFNLNNNDDDDDDFSEQINLDSLYEKKKNYDLNKLSIFKKLLSRVHVRIKTTARQKVDSQHCWFVVPEMIIGVPKYDQGACIAFLMDKLNENNFGVRYIHPNLLFISWKHWVPEYVRSEIKKKMGVQVDGNGNLINQNEETEKVIETNPNNFLLNTKNNSVNLTKKVNANPFKPVKAYKPSGIYNKDFFGGFDK